MNVRRLLLVGGLVVVMGALAFIGVRELLAVDPYSTEPLVADMNELTAAEPPNSFGVYVTECTGEGSFPATVNVNVDDASLGAYRARAIDLGWVEDPAFPDFAYERSDRMLYIDSGDPSGVALSVQGSEVC